MNNQFNNLIINNLVAQAYKLGAHYVKLSGHIQKISYEA